MIRKLFKSGNGWAIFIPKTILELLKVNPETDLLEIQIENDVLKIKKVKDKNKQ
jgi:antitoxin component of MazEF toxin-antitoxin module